MPLIKRYPNRKLYDTEAKCYVTLDGIAQLIQSGVDVQVVDYESGDDLTNLTLSQIIFEQEKKGVGFLPRTLLTGLIRTGGETLDFLRRNLHSMAPEEDPPASSPPSSVSEEERAVGMAREWALLHTIDEHLSSVLHYLNVPSYRDLKALQEQVEELTTRLEVVNSRLADSKEETHGSPAASTHAVTPGAVEGNPHPPKKKP